MHLSNSSDEMCEPCGGCPWCADNRRARRIAESLSRRQAALNRNLEQAIDTLAFGDPEDEQPIVRSAIAGLRRARKSINDCLKS